MGLQEGIFRIQVEGLVLSQEYATFLRKDAAAANELPSTLVQDASHWAPPPARTAPSALPRE